MAENDLLRSIERVRTFKYEAPRAYAMLAIAKAVLNKPFDDQKNAPQIDYAHGLAASVKAFFMETLTLTSREIPIGLTLSVGS